MLSEIALIAGAYLLGSLPHLSLLARLRRVNLNGDFHQTLWNEGGKSIAVIGILGEFSKGIIPVLIGKALDFEPLFVALAGLIAVVGQMWPVFHRFDGEKGNSIALAMVFALSYQAALVGIVPVLIALLVRTLPRILTRSRGKKPVVGGPYSRSLPVGMFICFILLPPAAWYFDDPPAVVWTLVALFVLMIIIRRLTAGLSADLKSGRDIKSILFNRLMYDRSKISWRRPQT